MSTKTARPATDKQISYLLALLEQREVEPSYAFELKIGLEDLDIREASKAIDNLKSYPRRVEVAITQTAPRPVRSSITEDGMYVKDGVVYKVQFAVHGSGNLYAKRLVVAGECQGHLDTSGNSIEMVYCDGACDPSPAAEFVYEAGAVNRLAPEDKMTLEAAQAFGRLYGICCRCGATLTDETSIAAGIVPVCGSRF